MWARFLQKCKDGEVFKQSTTGPFETQPALGHTRCPKILGKKSILEWASSENLQTTNAGEGVE